MLTSLTQKLIAVVIYYSGVIKILRLLGRNYAKVIVFHSIADVESDFVKGTNVWTSAAKFAKHLHYIRKRYRVISLQDLVSSLRSGRIPKNSIVITFDDGFADNFHVAYPLLRQYQIPATIFLVTDCIENKQPIWIQELCYLISKVGSQKIAEKLDAVAKELNGPQFNPTNSSKRKLGLNKALEEYLAFAVKKEMRGEILTRLYSDFTIQKEKVLSQNEIFLNWDQVKQMQQNGITFGNHGASHTPLSALPSSEQKNEIQQSKHIIEERLGESFLPFSYPFGMGKYYTQEAKEMVINSGHSCIVTAKPTLNSVYTSPFELGRIDVKDVAVPILAFELEKGVLKKILRAPKNSNPRSKTV
jgi:peptidoglycan/xylan/chitin deacetylase (PgdA/CDA1 family)